MPIATLGGGGGAWAAEEYLRYKDIAVAGNIQCS